MKAMRSRAGWLWVAGLVAGGAAWAGSDSTPLLKFTAGEELAKGDFRHIGGVYVDAKDRIFVAGDKQVAVYNAKGGKARGVPLLTDAVDAIRSWLLVRPAKMNSFLFTTVCGNRIHPTRMQIIWKRVLRDSGITKQGVSVNLGANGRRKAEQREQSLVVLPARRRGRNAAGLPPV